MNDDDLLADIRGRLREATATLRPSIELAVETIGRALSNLPGGGSTPQLQGPELWTWVDRHGKVFAVGMSPEHDGHPMMTIRQAISLDLDSWLVTSSLLLGKDANSILNSATLLIVNHAGAYAGYESTVKAVVAGGSPLAGLDRAVEIAGKDPSVNKAIAAVLRGETGNDDGGMN